MIQNLLRHLGGIERYGIVSLCLFGTIFLVVLLWTVFQKKSHLEYMSRVALDPDSDQNRQQSNSHE
jgi:hypothetical protein